MPHDHKVTVPGTSKPFTDEFLIGLRARIKKPDGTYPTLGVVMHNLIDDLLATRARLNEITTLLEQTRHVFATALDAADIDESSSIRARHRKTGEVLAEVTFGQLFEKIDTLTQGGSGAPAPTANKEVTDG